MTRVDVVGGGPSVVSYTFLQIGLRLIALLPEVWRSTHNICRRIPVEVIAGESLHMNIDFL